MILYRLVEDYGGLPEGACISEEKFRTVYYTEMALFEVISDFEIPDLIEYHDTHYCIKMGIERVIFYSDLELQKFIDKNIDNGIAG